MQDDLLGGVCVGPRCREQRAKAFQRDRHSYAPKGRAKGKVMQPVRNYAWKASLRVPLHSEDRIDEVSGSFTRQLMLPQALGLKHNGKWRWPLTPCSLRLGCESSLELPPAASRQRTTLHLWPSLRISLQKKILGKSLGLNGVIQVLPKPVLTLRKSFNPHPRKFSLANFMGSMDVRAVISREGNGMEGRKLRTRFEWNWKPFDQVRISSTTRERQVDLDVEQLIEISNDSTLLVGSQVVTPVPRHGLRSSSKAILAAGASTTMSAVTFDFIRFGPTLDNATEATPARNSVIDPDDIVEYQVVQNRSSVPNNDVIAVVAGHWIDPWDEPGAPGEREFNMEIANRLERRLKTSGWRVLRPERDAPSLRWEDYLQWVGFQSRRGVPVVEIHGQGETADLQGQVTGVLGTRLSPLNQELAQEFGFFPMDWRELALPRKGGVIVEAFNADEVNSLSREEKGLYADDLSYRIGECINRSGLNPSCPTSFCETAQDPNPAARILARGW
mmetsp:Transcript_4441/g.15876  ORF Transcript_4441/g.15876 Transcript_4441/m.15876 type:complete len:502 (-) Transcript_4441:183-1688(-)